MGKSIDDVKRELSGKYLGRAGIHAIGIARPQKAIRIYYSPQSAPYQSSVFKEIEIEAQPFNVIRIKDKPSKIT
jgi:hypothetical protein